MMGTSGPSEFTESQLNKICAVWPYTGWEDADTDQTILDAKINNARHDGFCGVPAPSKKKK